MCLCNITTLIDKPRSTDLLVAPSELLSTTIPQLHPAQENGFFAVTFREGAMPEPQYRVFIRVPINRGDFVDPPPVSS